MTVTRSLIKSGTAGDLSWAVSDNTLRISGAGTMLNYHLIDNTRPPWYKHHKSFFSVVIDEGINSIGNYAFLGCRCMTSIIIPASANTIGSVAFCECRRLTEIVNHATTPQTISPLVFHNVKIAACILYVPVASLAAYHAADVWKEFQIKGFVIGKTGSLSWSIFDETLTITGSGEMPDYEKESFPWYEYRTSITKVVIGDGVSNIGNYAFFECRRLISVNIPNSATRIGNYTFEKCDKLPSVIIPISVTSIGDGAFLGCSSLMTVAIPNSVICIGGCAFEGCCNLSFVDIPNSITGIAFGAFLKCHGLIAVTIPDSVTNIGSSAFEGCYNLTSVVIPNSVTNIGCGTFANCHSLTSVTIPKSVIHIGDGAFENCKSLTEIINHATIPQAHRPQVFSKIKASKCVLRIPAASLSKYRSARMWRTFQIEVF